MRAGWCPNLVKARQSRSNPDVAGGQKHMQLAVWRVHFAVWQMRARTGSERVAALRHTPVAPLACGPAPRQ